MFSSKAERILSRYRPIAPKPLPLPPSGSFGTTDPSSTCASVDSFTSSAKCKKPRKRRADDLASAKGLKLPKSMGSGLSNTGGASSVTQGASDGTVPPGDLRSASQISHGGLEDYGEMPNGTTRDARMMLSSVRFSDYGSSGAAPLFASDAGNMQRVHMSSDGNTQQAPQQHHAFSLLQQKFSSGYNCNSGGFVEKDIEFMERAAAATPAEASAMESMCDSAGGKGVGYVGGGFTEMIRGITRLPTVADVQSLMQVRILPSVASGSTRSSPTCSREMLSRRPDHLPLPTSASLCMIGKSPPFTEADQVCESNAELTTLSLLPNVPSRMCSPGKAAIGDGSSSAHSPTHGVPYAAEAPWHQQGSSRLEPPLKSVTPSVPPTLHGLPHVVEHPWHHQVSARLDPLARMTTCDVYPSPQPSIHGAGHFAGHPWHQVTHVAEPPWNQQVSSRIDSFAKAVIRDGSSSAQPLLPGVTHVMGGAPWHQQVASQLEPSAMQASRSPYMSHAGMELATGIPPFAPLSKKPINGLATSSMNPPSMGMASPVMANGVVIDEASLEQVYGGSTDPVLLLDDNNQVLWSNKSYDKAQKSASERSSGKIKPTGPYIDPLGHPTPLCSFVFHVNGKPVRATLWGFLKKLVIQESELPLQQGLPGPFSQLQLCMGEVSLRTYSGDAAPMEASGRMGSVVCSSDSRLTTVTLESVTEFSMDVPTIVECVEAAEARLAEGSEPAFIMDCLNRVRWVNAALKQMLGHANFEIMNTRSGASVNSGADVAMSSSLEASTFVVCCTEKIPRAAWAFSCRVNLEWMKGNKRRSMTVPCDVLRLACTSRSSEISWVWQFDMSVSLCLNVPS